MVIYMQINDLVTINDESNSIIYIIEEMNDDIVLLKGFTCRVKKYKRISEITKATIEHINIEKEKLKNQERKILRSNKMRTNAKPLFGRILHIDGDKDYLDSCMNLYKEMNIYAEGIYIREKDIKNKIEDIILKTTPDIVVITGHDVYNGKGYKDLTNYENTVHYIDVVRLIRKKYYYKK